MIVTGQEAGTPLTEISNITDLDTSNVSRRSEAAKQRNESDAKLAYAKDRVEKIYRAKIAESRA